MKFRKVLRIVIWIVLICGLLVLAIFGLYYRATSLPSDASLIRRFISEKPKYEKLAATQSDEVFSPVEGISLFPIGRSGLIFSASGEKGYAYIASRKAVDQAKGLQIEFRRTLDDQKMLGDRVLYLRPIGGRWHLYYLGE